MSKLILGEGVVSKSIKKSYKLCIGIMVEAGDPLLKYPLESIEKNEKNCGDLSDRRIILVSGIEGKKESCPFLIRHSCAIYPHRPIICRSLG